MVLHVDPVSTMRARDYQPGDHVSGTVYEIIRLIGAGGMGSVYDVEDTTIGKRYVLKTLHAQLGAREDLARRIQNEARTLARLHHPNIVEVITAGVTADDLRLPYYVMERLNGQSLRIVLEKKGRLDLAHAYHIGIDLLDALDHAHDKGVIHRDVKPDNIFLHRTAGGVTITKLLDFGIVSVFDGGHRDTAGRFLGTLRYAAPEQLRGEKPTPKMDVYAAGLVLYETIAGRGPFDDQGESSRIAAAHMNSRPPPISQFADVPTELESLLMAALAKDPDRRPRDAFSFAASLRNLKRQLQGSSPESTENRVTAPAVMGPESGSPFSSVRQASPDGPYVVSPAPDPRTGLAKSTLSGMAPPTTGGTLESTMSRSATATTPDSVDRAAATLTAAAERPRDPREGTESMRSVDPCAPSGGPPAEGGILPSEPMLAGAEASLEWPAERSPAPSEEPPPQVQSLPAERVPGRSLRPVVAGAVAAAMLLAVAGFLAVTLRASRSGDLGSRPVVAMSPAAPAPPSASPPVMLPAPTIAPPAFEDVPAPVTSARAAPAASSAPSAVSSAHRPPAPVVPPSAPGKVPAASHRAPDRPGPGF